MQIAIEEQHGANPFYTYAKPVGFGIILVVACLVYEYSWKRFNGQPRNEKCGGATTADFDFQMDYLPKVWESV